MYRLVASDLDGTLLRNDQTLSPENSEAITQMHAAGVQFAISTGRTYGEIPEVLRQHPGIRWYICSDGGLIYDKQENRSHTVCMEGSLQKLVLDADDARFDEIVRLAVAACKKVDPDCQVIVK